MWKLYLYKGIREPPQAIIRACGLQRLSMSTPVWLPNCEFKAWKRGVSPAQRVYKAAAFTTRCSGSAMTELVDGLFLICNLGSNNFNFAILYFGSSSCLAAIYFKPKCNSCTECNSPHDQTQQTQTRTRAKEIGWEDWCLIVLKSIY